MMGPDEIVLCLEPGHERRNEAWVALVAVLEGLLAGGPLVERWSKTSFIVPPSERRELCQDVALKLVGLSPLPVAGKPAGMCVNYFKTTLVNAWINLLRERRRYEERASDIDLITPGSRPSSVPPPPSGPGTGGPDDRIRLRATLEEAMALARSQRAERYRSNLEQAWRQFVRLFFEKIQVEQILREEGLPENATGKDLYRARNRIYKNQERLRGALLDAIDQHPTWTPEERAQGRRCVLACLRCQRSSSVASITGGSRTS